MKNLPLSYKKRSCFEPIVQHFGGLVNIFFQSLNFIDRTSPRIEVRKYICGFIPPELVVTNEKSVQVMMDEGFTFPSEDFMPKM